MSYLHAPRLTFSGQFQADTSTVNNDPTHFNNDTFISDYQNYQDADNMNGWWNPDGTGNWRLQSCTIKSVTYKDGTSTSNPMLDPAIGMTITDTDSRSAGKIVDLDSEQQMVSELWGFVVRIVSQDGTEMMKGNYVVSPFTNIWFNRSVDKSADEGAAAMYQSILKGLEWNEAYANSRYLRELKENSEGLSIQFTVDRYHGNNSEPRFTFGRIAGSIGPYKGDEPKRFVAGRQLYPAPQQSTTNYAVALVDEELSQIVLDLSNSLQCSDGGLVHESRDLRMVINNTQHPKQPTYEELGKIQYKDPDWYLGHSGVCTFKLTPDQLASAKKNPLGIISVTTQPSNDFTKELKESSQYVFVEEVDYVRADQFVFRADPGETCSIDFYATHLGAPMAAASISIEDKSVDNLGNMGMKGAQPPTDTWPRIGIPNQEAFPNGKTQTFTTDSNGKGTYTFLTSDPMNPRKYIDGQVYGLSYNFSDAKSVVQSNSANFISLMVYDGPPKDIPNPDWKNFVGPIMQQYANLYPLMSKGIFNLADKDVVDKNADILSLVFSKDLHDPNYMPSTRDLSGYKTKVILDYLQSVMKKP